MAQESQKQQQIKIRYNETSSLFASQFLLNSSEEDVTVNFSSGPLTDPAGGESVLPIHTRISMSKAGAKRLYDILGKILSQPEASGQVAEGATAQFPKMQ